MTKAEKIARLSPVARKLWDRVQDPANFYPTYGTTSRPTPKAMAELERAGLVVCAGRVVSMQACFVPKGTKPFRLEAYPK